MKKRSRGWNSCKVFRILLVLRKTFNQGVNGHIIRWQKNRTQYFTGPDWSRNWAPPCYSPWPWHWNDLDFEMTLIGTIQPDSNLIGWSHFTFKCTLCLFKKFITCQLQPVARLDLNLTLKTCDRRENVDRSTCLNGVLELRTWKAVQGGADVINTLNRLTYLSNFMKNFGTAKKI